jgi:hypothetical protein
MITNAWVDHKATITRTPLPLNTMHRSFQELLNSMTEPVMGKRLSVFDVSKIALDLWNTLHSEPSTATATATGGTSMLSTNGGPVTAREVTLMDQLKEERQLNAVHQISGDGVLATVLTPHGLVTANISYSRPTSSLMLRSNISDGGTGGSGMLLLSSITKLEKGWNGDDIEESMTIHTNHVPSLLRIRAAIATDSIILWTGINRICTVGRREPKRTEPLLTPFRDMKHTDNPSAIKDAIGYTPDGDVIAQSSARAVSSPSSVTPIIQLSTPVAASVSSKLPNTSSNPTPTSTSPISTEIAPSVVRTPSTAAHAIPSTQVQSPIDIPKATTIPSSNDPIIAAMLAGYHFTGHIRRPEGPITFPVVINYDNNGSLILTLPNKQITIELLSISRILLGRDPERRHPMSADPELCFTIITNDKQSYALMASTKQERTTFDTSFEHLTTLCFDDPNRRAEIDRTNDATRPPSSTPPATPHPSVIPPVVTPATTSLDNDEKKMGVTTRQASRAADANNNSNSEGRSTKPIAAFPNLEFLSRSPNVIRVYTIMLSDAGSKWVQAFFSFDIDVQLLQWSYKGYVAGQLPLDDIKEFKYGKSIHHHKDSVDQFCLSIIRMNDQPVRLEASKRDDVEILVGALFEAFEYLGKPVPKQWELPPWLRTTSSPQSFLSPPTSLLPVAQPVVVGKVGGDENKKSQQPSSSTTSVTPRSLRSLSKGIIHYHNMLCIIDTHLLDL